MKEWLKLPVKQRMELRKAYEEAGISYKDGIKDFEQGGQIQDKSRWLLR